MKNILLAVFAVLVMAGCGSVDSTPVDLGSITPQTEITEQICNTTFPDIGYTANSDLIKSILATQLSSSINPGSIQMNHYIAETITNESFNPVIDYYLGDSLTPASLQLAADASTANPVEHIVIIKFVQDGPPPSE